MAGKTRAIIRTMTVAHWAGPTG